MSGARSTKATLGFVGLGNMGGNMAARLLAAGYAVHGESRRREEAEHLIEAGLAWCDTPREVAEAADVVFTSLPSDQVIEEVASGPDGVLAGLAKGKTWVEVSTISPEKSRDVAARVDGLGAKMLDAPVSGSVPQVKSGTLTIMVGGDEDAYRHVEPILRELGTPNYIGDNGQGLAVKLAINISLAVQMIAFAEGLLLAERSGVDRQRALDVMAESAIGSPMLRARASIVLDPPTRPGSASASCTRTSSWRSPWREGSRFRSRPRSAPTRSSSVRMPSATNIVTSRRCSRRSSRWPAATAPAPASSQPGS
jgi:3-hydroxyisobutyrate dehydrogenase-like beta-hydroxyacid dehydrogenase